MPAYKYLIFDEDYTITGTDSEKEALQAAEFEIVIDTSTGEIIEEGGDRSPVPANDTYKAS
jgi:hypothetical protein